MLGGFLGGSVVKNMPAKAGDIGGVDSILGSGRSPIGGNGNPFQYSCLENFMDRGAWRASAWSHKELDMTEQAPTHGINGTEIARKSVKSFFFFF